MTTWTNIPFHRCYIMAETQKSYKIRIPGIAKSEYDYFYVPRGCVRNYYDLKRLCIPSGMTIILRDCAEIKTPMNVFADTIQTLFKYGDIADENYTYTAPDLKPEIPIILPELIDEN